MAARIGHIDDSPMPSTAPPRHCLRSRTDRRLVPTLFLRSLSLVFREFRWCEGCHLAPNAARRVTGAPTLVARRKLNQTPQGSRPCSVEHYPLVPLSTNK